MEKKELDQLYHLLRQVSNESADSKSTEFADIIYGLSKHLFAGGDYLRLIQYSKYYGELFLLEPTYEAIHKKEWKPTRVVEFGAGLGWLGRGLATKLGLLPALLVDKRPWTMIDVVADLETEGGRTKVLVALKEGDLIVAADLLHCLDSPKEIMSHFSSWPAAILEYCSTNNDYAKSYTIQLHRYGAKPLMPEEYEELFPGRKVDIVDLDPYILLLVDKEE